ncbi:MAG: DHH family phosphoesterase [Eubacteriales bacterium]|nr:DHH family phosphoesterase [Eubacteriales bacterium]
MASIEKMAEWFAASQNLVLMGHVFPDGDASGSVMALKLAAEAMGKRAAAYLPGGLAKLYAFLPRAGEFVGSPKEMDFLPESAMAVDVADIARLGDGEGMFRAAKDTAVLDHHGTNPGFGRVNCVDAQRAATGELALALIKKLGVFITPEMASWLYTAICTDCGQFGYANTTGNTMRAAAECVDAGAEPEYLTKMLYRTRTEARTRLLGLVLGGLSVECEGKIASAVLTEEMLARAGASREENEGIVNYLVEISGVKIGILAEQRGRGAKLSLRSAKGYDVARDVAVPLGGGGHANAAGVSMDVPVKEALKIALEKARAAVRT